LGFTFKKALLSAFLGLSIEWLPEFIAGSNCMQKRGFRVATNSGA
jgi:hypothetical protein